MTDNQGHATRALIRTAAAFRDELDAGLLHVYLDNLASWEPQEWTEAERTVIRDEIRFPTVAKWREHLNAARRAVPRRDYHDVRDDRPELEPTVPRCPICERPDEVEKLDRAIRGRGWSCGRCRLTFSGSQAERLAMADRRAAYVHVPDPEFPPVSLEDVRALLADMRQIVRRA